MAVLFQLCLGLDINKRLQTHAGRVETFTFTGTQLSTEVKNNRKII